MTAKRRPKSRVRGVSFDRGKWRVGIQVNRKRTYKRFNTQEGAERYALKLHAASDNAPDRIVTLGQAMDLVEDELREDRSPRTLDFYQCHFRALLRAWSRETPLHRITRDDIKAFLAARRQQKHPRSGKTLSPTTVQKSYTVLNRIFNFAVREGFVMVNPLAGIRAPRAAPRREDWFTREEIDDIRQTILESDFEFARLHAAVICFPFWTGGRLEELAQMEPEDIDLERGLVRIYKEMGKTREPRYVHIQGNKAIDDACVLLDSAEGGKPFRGNHEWAQGIFKRWARRLGLEGRLRPHAMRHSFASHLGKNPKMTPNKLATLLGHKDTKMVARYFHMHSTEVMDALGDLQG